MGFPVVAEIYLDGGCVQAKAVHPRGSRELAVEGEVAVDPVTHDGEPAPGRLDA